jgi:hypothetical protein
VAAHDADPEPVGGESAAEVGVEALLVDELPELVTERRVMLVAADEHELERDRPRGGPRRAAAVARARGLDAGLGRRSRAADEPAPRRG